MSSLSANGATSTVYLKEESGTFYTKINNGSWSPRTLPLTIINANPTPASNVLKILFEGSITVTSTNHYLSCGSAGLQFGSTSLNTDGTRATILVDGVTGGYPGFIKNGAGLTDGEASISVYNLFVTTTNGSILADAAGWIGQEYYGKNASANRIVNCSSDGDISQLGGGIVGQSAGSEAGGSLTLRGCSSSGAIGAYGGGIVGHYGGYIGSITCEQCWSTGTIGTQSGGIFGDYGGTGGSATATQCYSQGTIGQEGGGIFGAYAAESSGTAAAEKCYSRGEIDLNAGGIFGYRAGYNFGTTNAINCYSSGTITTSGTGIYGTEKRAGATFESNCYASNSSWSDSTASTTLSGTPSGVVGTVWISRVSNQPYELNGIGYTPYTIDILNSSGELVQTFSQSIQQGETTQEALNPDASGNAFSILKKEGGNADSYGTISINAQTGAITTTRLTKTGIYTLTIRSVGSYNITTFSLTVTNYIETSSATCCQRTSVTKNVDYATRYAILDGNIQIGSSANPRTPVSYSDIYKKKMAYASKQ